MKWRTNKKTSGTTEMKSGFLWLPMTINGETRWLEFARWEVLWEEWGIYDEIIPKPIRWA